MLTVSPVSFINVFVRLPILFQFVQYYSLIFSIFVCIYDSEDHFYHWIPVEVPISGLLIEHGPISYKDPSTGLVNVSIETGTHVNWTCYVNGNATDICSNIDLDWENQGGEYLFSVANANYTKFKPTEVNFAVFNWIFLCKLAVKVPVNVGSNTKSLCFT